MPSQLNIFELFSLGLNASLFKARINQSLSGIVLLSSELRGFAPSRDTSGLARSLDCREETMISDLKHYAAIK